MDSDSEPPKKNQRTDDECKHTQISIKRGPTIFFQGNLVYAEDVPDSDVLKTQCMAALPHRQYEIIVFEPHYKERMCSCSAPDLLHMRPKELKEFPMASLAAPACLLFLWCDSYTLKTGMDLFHAWGFNYCTVWIVLLKRYRSGLPFMGSGQFTKPSTEFLLVASKPRTPHARWKSMHRSDLQEYHTIRANRRPMAIMTMIQAVYKNRNGYLHLCAPVQEHGWDCWGTAIPGYFTPG